MSQVTASGQHQKIMLTIEKNTSIKLVTQEYTTERKKNIYEANVCINIKPKHIGVYKSIEEAVNGRKEFIIQYNIENNTNLKYEEFVG
ncbi:ATP-dependent DNA helicase [Staphylococcus phage qdsa001]|nr:ATP-dependent DNA helicase [Staphylococcus phage qdsa001]